MATHIICDHCATCVAIVSEEGVHYRAAGDVCGGCGKADGDLDAAVADAVKEYADA